jgi:hypothetical protein
MHANSNCPIDKGRIPSSGLELLVDPATMSGSLKHRYANTTGPIFSTAQGNMHATVSANYFIGHGWIPVAQEYDRWGRIASTLQYGAAEDIATSGFESGDRGTFSYRAFRQVWTDCPSGPPRLVANSEGNRTALYVSWNGATEVIGWTVRGGLSANNLHYITNQAKTGFETEIHIEQELYAQVVPVFAVVEIDNNNGFEYACAYAGNMASDIVAVSS